MKTLSKIAMVTALFASAVTLNPGVASANSGLNVLKIQTGKQIINGNSSRQNSGGASNSYSGGINGTKRVCCTTFTHKNGYSGCATFQAQHCPNYARFTPAPE